MKNDHFHPDFDDPCLTVVIVCDLNDVAILAHAILFQTSLLLPAQGGGSLFVSCIFCIPRQTCHGAQGIQIVRGATTKVREVATGDQLGVVQRSMGQWAVGVPQTFHPGVPSRAPDPEAMFCLGQVYLGQFRPILFFFRFWPFWGLGFVLLCVCCCCGCVVVLCVVAQTLHPNP